MIFVTVGTHNAPFDRLIQWMDDIAGRLDEPVVLQIGSATFIPTRGQSFRFCSSEELQQWILQSRAVVTHGGASIREALQTGRPAIVVPRLAKFKEVVNDHQVELAEVLARRGMITIATDLPSLEKALRDPKLPVGQLQSAGQLIRALQKILEQFT